MAKKYLDSDGLLYLWSKITGKFQPKETGKGLSTNDLTNDLKKTYDDTVTKVGNLVASGGEPNVIEAIQKNGSALAITNKTVNITVPTKTSELTNDSSYVTTSAMNTAISTEVGKISGIDFKIMSSLPSTGIKGTIYLVSNSGSGQNVYDEYIYVNNRFEKIGTSDIDLSGYVKDSDLSRIENTEIDTIVA